MCFELMTLERHLLVYYLINSQKIVKWIFKNILSRTSMNSFIISKLIFNSREIRI